MKAAVLEPTEADFQKQVIELAQLCGWRTAHFRPGMNRSGRWSTPVQGDGKGFPDLLMVRGRRVIVAELKTSKGRLSQEQEEWLAAFSLADVPAFVWRPGDWDRIVEALR